MAQMSDFHVVGDPRYAPDAPGGGGWVSKEYVDNADINVKKTAAKGHNTKYDETVIPSQYTNKLYVYGNPESMYHASDIGGEMPEITQGHIEVGYNYWGQLVPDWYIQDNRIYDDEYSRLCAIKVIDQQDSNWAYWFALCFKSDESIASNPNYDDYPSNSVLYGGLTSKQYLRQYANRPPEPQGWVEYTGIAYIAGQRIRDTTTEQGQYYGCQVSGIPIFVVNNNSQSEWDKINHYIATGDYSNASNINELYPDNPESFTAIDVISGDWYTVVNNTWVKQGTLNLSETGGTEVVANPIGEPTDTLSTISIDGVIYSIDGGGGGGTEVEEKLYDNGTEYVNWSVSGGTKNSDNISINVGGGVFTNGTYTTNVIDITDYTKIKVKYEYNGTVAEKEVDISEYTGNRYISFYYLTDYSHNECGICLSETAGTFATGIELERATFVISNCKLYELSIIKQGSSSGKSLSDLSDVDLTNLSDGQILQYNSNTEKWENANNQGSLPFEFVIDPNDSGINIVYDDSILNGGE